MTLQFRQVKLTKVFDAITQQTGLTVAYSRPTVDPDRMVTIEAKDEDLSNVLSKLFTGTNVAFEIGEKKIYLKEKKTSDSLQQTRKTKKISGTVLDEKGEPVIGASILVDETSNGTITNIDGEYSLTGVPENSTLTISYVGYKTIKLKASDKNLSNIILQEDSELIDEVVVVGYGVQRKRDVTGAMTSVDATKIASVPVTSASEALQGRASGVLVSQDNWAPGTSPSVLIRGKRSINASNEPLYVVDGVPITGGLREISPSDIASMEVLKDASATAIYGSRGANGVVLITTKQGKDGKTQVDYSGYFGVQTMQNKLDLMNGAQYAEYVREAYRNTNSSNKYPTDHLDKAADIANPMFKQDAYVLESLMMAYDENGNYDYEALNCIDVKQFNEDMEALLAGKRVELPVYNFVKGEREYKGDFLQLGAEDILVIEGIHCLNDDLSYSLPRDKKFKIYISALTQLNIDDHNRVPTTDGRLIRRMVRDARTRGASAQDTIRMWDSVRRGEERNIFPYQEEADAMFNSAFLYELSVLKQYAEPILYSVPRDSAEYNEAKRLLKFLDYFLGVSSEQVPHNSIVREFIGGSCFKV